MKGVDLDMLRIKFGRKVFEDNKTWYHTDYMCRREVVEIGNYRKMLRFMGYRVDPLGSPKVAR